MTLEWWQQLRRLRANPPGLAAKGARKGTFGAALQQAEDLADAARTIGPWAQPILLYYALNQAGRAVIAAQWRDKGWNAISSHGLGELPPDTRNGDTDGLASYRVEAFKSGWFPALAMASSMSGEAAGTYRVGDIWAAVPDLLDVDLPGSARRPLTVHRQSLAGPLGGEITQDARAHVCHGTKFLPPNDFAKLIENYPLDGWAWHSPQGAGPHRSRVSGREGWELAWEVPRSADGGVGASEQERIALLDTFAPEHRYVEQRFVLPTLNGTDFTPLALWAMFLFSLSSLARYHSAEWVAALDLDNSPLAAPLRESLEIASDVLPHLLYQAAVGKPVVVPHPATGRWG